MIGELRPEELSDA